MELEKKLLILTCDLNPSKEKKAEIKKFISSHNINWNHFFELIYKNGTYPLVHHNFEEILPKEQKKEFIINLVSAKIYNDMLLKELIHISELFKKNDIPFIVLKGLPLAKILYGDYNLRSTSDIDLLVKKGNVKKAELLLKKEGYKFHCPYASKKRCLENDKHISFYNKKKKIMIEIHWSIITYQWDFEILEKDYKKNLRKIEINDKIFYIFNPEFLFIYLCIHLISHSYVSHGWIGLRNLYDLALILDKYSLDWNRINYLSKKYKISTFVYHIILRAKKIFKTKIPKKDLIELKRNSSKIGLFILNSTDLNFSFEIYKIRLAKFLMPLKSEIKFNKCKSFLKAYWLPTKETLAKKYKTKPDSILIYPYYIRNWFRQLFKIRFIFMRKV